jgi:hypothetical protein
MINGDRIGSGLAWPPGDRPPRLSLGMSDATTSRSNQSHAGGLGTDMPTWEQR